MDTTLRQPGAQPDNQGPTRENQLMAEYEQRYARVGMERAEAIVDFFFDVFEAAAARLRAHGGHGTKH